MAAERQEKQQKPEKQEKQEKELCSICADSYTAVIRRKITCKYCSKDTCSKCIEQYLLSRVEDAHCIHCRVNYNDATLKEICTKTYLQQTYFRHRQEILIGRERANLPGLQDEAQRARRKKEMNREIQEVMKEKKEIQMQRNDLSKQILIIYLRIQQTLRNGERVTMEEYDENRGLMAQDAELKSQLRKCNDKRYEIRRHYWRMDHPEREADRQAEEDEEAGKSDAEDGDEKADDQGDEKVQHVTQEKKSDRKKFIRRCMKAGCQGFLTTAWKCGLCEHYSCSKCFTIRGPNHDSPHTCQKEDLETADMIRLDSKPCPGCGEFINKSSGCNQIFCISCHTPWDWVTGKIVTHGAIHNPHYYEWLKRNGGDIPRNPADVPCGGYPYHNQLRNLAYSAPKNGHFFYEFYRLAMILQDKSQQSYQSHMDQAATFQQIHVQFLINAYDEKQWGRRLAMAEKRRKRDAEIQEVFAAFRMVAVEFINRIQNYRDETVDTFSRLRPHQGDAYMEKWQQEVMGLVEMMNDGFRNIGIAYGYQTPYIVPFVNHRGKMEYRYREQTWKEETRRKRQVSNTEEQKASDEPEDPFEEDEDLEEDEDEDEDEDTGDEKEDTTIQLAILRSLQS